MKIGMNDNWINYYQTNGRFNDVMIGTTWGGPPGPIDPAVLPVGAQTIAATEGYTRPGIYTVSATGIGQLFVGISASNLLVPGPGVLPTNVIANFTGKNETYTFKLGKSGRTLMQIRASDPKTPLGNIKIMAPGAGPGLYHPEFLAALSPFDTIRFMDPQQTSGSKEVYWAERVTRKTECLEAMISLANQLQRNLWICVPAHVIVANGAPTDYANKLGDLINSCVDPKLTVYLEYSNEVWNWGQPWWDETTYVTNQSAADYEGTTTMRMQYARLAYRVFNTIIARINPNNGPKIVRVLAGQLAAFETVYPSLDWAMSRGYKFDALAGGMYWSVVGDINAIKAAWTSGDQQGALKLLDDGFRKGSDQMLGWVKAYATLAKKYNIDLLAYEGGPACGLWQDPVGLPIIKAYTQSSLCRQQHLDTFNALDVAGTKLFMYYSYSHNDGTWASRLNAGDFSNRRYRTCVEYIVGSPPAQFLGIDNTTQGNWIGTYGSLNATIAGAPASIQPMSSVINIPQTTPYSMPGVITDIRGLQLPDGSARVAAWWYSSTQLNIDIPAPTDGSLRILSLYFVEWQKWLDSFNVQLVNADTGVVLDTRSITSFDNGIYLRWVIEGHIQIRLIKTAVFTAGSNAKVSGIFLDPVSPL